MQQKFRQDACKENGNKLGRNYAQIRQKYVTNVYRIAKTIQKAMHVAVKHVIKYAMNGASNQKKRIAINQKRNYGKSSEELG